jgi:protein-disulfide isomerase
MKRLSLALFSTVFLFACNASDKQIEDWVAKNPDKILNALMDHQRKQQEENMPKPEMVKENHAALFENAGSPTLGNGKVEVAYFFDFNCGHCARQGQTIKDVMAKTDKVKIIYKNFPVLGPSSELAAQAALAAHQQGKYQEFYNELWQTREKNPETMKKIAAKLKLDMKKFEADMNSEAVNKEIEHVRELATKMKVGGTPFLAIAPDKVFPGRVDELLQVVNSIN